MALWTQQASFIPDITIECSPAYRQGVRDSVWVSWRDGKKPTTQQQLREAIGMPILAGSAVLVSQKHKVCD